VEALDPDALSGVSKAMAHETLNDESLADWLAEREGWKREDGTLVKEYRFESFRNAVVFVNRVATAADRASHYPDIHLHRRTVRLRIRTSEVDGLTRGDLELAEKIDMATPRR